MIDLPHVEDFVLQLENNVRPKKARCSKFLSIGQQTTQITSITSLTFASLNTCHLILPKPGWDFTDHAIYVFSFLPHYASLLLYSVGVGSPDQFCSTLVGVCSVQSCLNIFCLFFSFCFISFVKTVFLFPVSLQLHPSIINLFSLKKSFQFYTFLLEQDYKFLKAVLLCPTFFRIFQHTDCPTFF